MLAERHAAPPVLDVLPVEGRTALLFPFVDAPVATRGTLHERYDEARSVLAGLHDDAELAALLGAPDDHRATASARSGCERFEADLDIIEGYVAKDLHAYLTDEVDALGVLIDELDGPSGAAVHGDPWHENFLVAPDRLWLLDWEDLSVGDPVVDDAILRPRRARHRPAPLAGHAASHAVARRALMLDAVVDAAADWVENTDPAGPRGRRRRRTSRGWRPTERSPGARA